MMRRALSTLLSVAVLCLSATTAGAQSFMTFRGGDHLVTVTWKPARDTLARYRLFRATDSTSVGTDISGPLVRTTTFVDKTLTPGTLYFYSVEMSSPTAGPKPIRSAPQRFMLMKTPVALPPRKP